MKAFPVPTARVDTGMDLRDYFAAAAIPVAFDYVSASRFDVPKVEIPKRVAVICYDLADAMMERRNGPVR